MLELLSPAGDFECLQSALIYGCDAVYLGGKMFGMRAGSKNFDMETLEDAVKLAHSKGVKVYLTCNTLPTNDEAEQFPQFIKNAEKCGIDAVIVCDIGVMSMVKQYAPDLEIHMSTQVGIVNYVTANELYKMGAKRIVLAREVCIEEIKKIRDKIPDDMEIEAFVHGAMCVSFSGRCLLSTYLTGRDANRGECAQPCRWKYYLMEEKRQGQFFQLNESDEGSYILNAKDMCMIEHLGKLAEAGVSSFKIEGRAKSAYYVATVTNAYRHALDCMKKDQALPQWVKEEVFKVSHRPYCTGFYFDHPNACQYYPDSGYLREYDFVGVVDGYDNGILHLTQRNYFTKNDKLEILSPDGVPVEFKPEHIYNEQGQEIEIANRATEKLSIPYQKSFPAHSILRRPSVEQKQICNEVLK